jgi:hypothetical protein
MRIGKMGRMIVVGIVGDEESVEGIEHGTDFGTNLLADSREVCEILWLVYFDPAAVRTGESRAFVSRAR